MSLVTLWHIKKFICDCVPTKFHLFLSMFTVDKIVIFTFKSYFIVWLFHHIKCPLFCDEFYHLFLSATVDFIADSYIEHVINALKIIILNGH